MRILYLPNSYSQQRQREKPANIYPVRMAMEAEWYRKQGHEVYWLSSDYNDSWISHNRTYWLTQKWDKVIQEPDKE